MRGSRKDMRLAEDYGEDFRSHQAEWGGMVVELSTFPAGTDATPIFKGLPDDLCQAPHWGYVLKGRFRVRYKDREEVLQAGDAYYLEPGHVPIYDEATEVVEFSPKEPYERTLAVVARNMAAAPKAT